MQRYCDRCARASQEGWGGNLFVQRPGARLEPYSPLLLGDPAAGLLAGEGKDNPVLRFGNFYCQRDFNFRSAQLPTSLQEKGTGCFHVARSTRLREDGVRGGSPRLFFHRQLGNFFHPWKCSRKALRPLGLEKWLPF